MQAAFSAQQLSALQHFFSTHSVLGQHSLAHSPLSAFLQQQLTAQKATAAINKIFFITLKKLKFIFKCNLALSSKVAAKVVFYFGICKRNYYKNNFSAESYVFKNSKLQGNNKLLKRYHVYIYLRNKYLIRFIIQMQYIHHFWLQLYWRIKCNIGINYPSIHVVDNTTC